MKSYKEMDASHQEMDKELYDAIGDCVSSSDRVSSIDSDSSDVQVPSAKAVYTLYSSIPKWNVQMYESEEALPVTGVVGTIYLVPETAGKAKNVFKEFFWNDKESKYEQFGGIEVDISNLVTMKQVLTYLRENSVLSLSDDGVLSLEIKEGE